MYPTYGSRIIQISYDLITPGQKYTAIGKYVRSHGTWAKALESLWFIKTAKSTSQVMAELRAITDANDKLLVMDTTGDNWTSYGLSKEITDWFKANSPVLA